MRRFVSRSILCQSIAIIVGIIVCAILYDHLNFDLTQILIIWMAIAIGKGSVTACKWAVFVMSLYVALGLLCVYGIIADSPYVMNAGDGIRSTEVPVYLSVFALFFLWSVLNLVLTVRVLRKEGHKFFSKPAIAGIVCFVGVIASIALVSYFAIPAYARKGQLKRRYTEQIAFLREVVASSQGVLSNSPEVQACFEDHSEILEARIQTGRGAYMSILGSRVHSSRIWLGRFGTARDENGNKISIIVYTDYAKNAEGEWVKISMIIKDIWKRGP